MDWGKGLGRSGVAIGAAVGLLGAVPARAAEFGFEAQGNVTFRAGDEEAYDVNSMNRGDNPFSAFRLLLVSEAQINPNTSLFLETPVDIGGNSSQFLTYLRPFLRLTDLGGEPWLNLQAGKLPTLFGTYGERSASTETGVMGTPLLYYYHSALRGDVVPTGPDWFFQDGIRGSGYKSLTVSTRVSPIGMPPIYDACWDVGAEVYGASHGFQYSLAGTQGTVSRPATLGKDYNDGYQIAGRLGYQVESGVLFGLRLGVSGAMGPYLSESVETDPNFPAGATAEDFNATALGADLSYARGPWQIFAEGAHIGYEAPNVEPTLEVTSYYVEVVRDLLGPTLSLAARQEAALYSDLTGSSGTESWDYDVWRWEAALNFRFRPNTRFRVGYQSTRVPDFPEIEGDLFALQLQVWTR